MKVGKASRTKNHAQANAGTINDKSNRAIRSIGAVPYRLSILMPNNGGPLPRRIMMTNDFKDNEKVKDSLREFILGFLNRMGKFTSDKEAFSGLCVDSKTVDSSVENEIRFVLQAGRFGIESQLRNVDDPTKRKTREVDDCELLPFCCRMVFDDRHGGAIVIFEKFGVNSAVSIFRDELRKYVKEVFVDTGYEVELLAITNREYIEQKFKNAVKAIHFTRYIDPSDRADVLRGDSMTETKEKVKMKMSLYAPRGGVLKLLDKVNLFRRNNFVGVTIDGERYDRVSLELKAGKRTQTIVSSEDMFSVAFDLTDQVRIAASGHPEPSSFYEQSDECLKMSLKTLKWR